MHWVPTKQSNYEIIRNCLDCVVNLRFQPSLPKRSLIWNLLTPQPPPTGPETRATQEHPDKWFCFQVVKLFPNKPIEVKYSQIMRYFEMLWVYLQTSKTSSTASGASICRIRLAKRMGSSRFASWATWMGVAAMTWHNDNGVAPWSAK